MNKDKNHLKTAIAITVFVLIILFMFIFMSHFGAQAGLLKDLDGDIYYPEPPPEIRPIYYVYKNGTRVNACPEIQWMVWYLAGRHGYDYRYIFALIVRESTFRPHSINHDGPWIGLTQIHPFWTRNRLLADFRLTDDHADRCLYNPRDNILTLIEMWEYARYTYDIDISTEQGMAEILWWHFSGRFVEGVQHWEIDRTLQFIEELVPYPQPVRNNYEEGEHNGRLY